MVMQLEWLRRSCLATDTLDRGLRTLPRLLSRHCEEPHEVLFEDFVHRVSGMSRSCNPGRGRGAMLLISTLDAKASGVLREGVCGIASHVHACVRGVT